MTEFADGTGILALDPGNRKTGWVLANLSSEDPCGLCIVNKEVSENGEIRRQLLEDTLRSFRDEQVVLLIETPRPRGQPTSSEEMETLIEIGRFVQAWEQLAEGDETVRWSYVWRKDVKSVVCGSSRAKDSNIRAALIEFFGGEAAAIGATKCPECKGKGWKGRGRPICEECEGSGWDAAPGPLHGFNSHIWPALGVLVTWLQLDAPFAHEIAGKQRVTPRTTKKMKEKAV